MEKHCKQQLQEELIENFVEYSEGLSESSIIGAAVCPWEKEEEILPLLSEEGSGKEAWEEPQKPILKPLPTKLNPSATAQATNSPLPIAPFPDQVHLMPTPTTHETPETPTIKAIPSTLLALQNFKKLVAIVQTCATTSKTLATAHTVWHNGCLGVGLDLENLSISTSSTSFSSLHRLEKLVLVGLSLPHFLF